MAKLSGRGGERALQLQGEDAGVAELHGSAWTQKLGEKAECGSRRIATLLLSTKAVDRAPATADDLALRGRLQMAWVFHRPWPFDAIERR